MRPNISYIICTMPRSGSHLLGEALKNTSRAGKPDEYFICDQEGRLENERGNIAEIYGKKTLEEFRDLVLELGSTPNGVFGITIMWGYFYTILDNFRTLSRYQNMAEYDLVNALLCNPKYIWLVRRDKVRQAVSLSKALQTNVWSRPSGAGVKVEREPEFNFHSIEHHRKRLLEGDEGWEAYFERHHISPFKVVYEDFVERYEDTARDILEYLHIPTDDLSFERRQLRKQSNVLNEDWVARYYSIKKSQNSRSILSRFLHYLSLILSSYKHRRQERRRQ